MPRPVPYVMCRYEMTINDNPLSAREQYQILQRIRGTLVVHRKADPGPDDADTLIMRPKRLVVSGRDVLTWDVGQQLTGRSEAYYDSDTDEVHRRWSDGDAVRYASFVAVPSLGALAVNDRTGEIHLGSAAGIARMKTIFRNAVEGGDIAITQAATHADARRAVDTWTLDRFDFAVRPFNPHPRDPGRMLSEIMARDNIGALQGRAVPAAGKEMRKTDGGYIEEAVGLADAGYGQYGMRGRTPEGREVALKKPRFDLDKERNENIQAGPQQLRVFLESHDDETDEFKEAAAALIEFYGQE
ncbi:hypothetical protein MKK67_12075 [Methylobacterium sp. J-072]|uniref:hypothetical protein n=1 Tax=Methylobacterium sp. J-072 TaxID=2836651 RepID=UPI001FB8F6DB|nr:hypothetical protein [Methylobacterium sp. J-072]MCJ2093221.1 hypothetical protein [Methylobacterium sp. J-072]